MRNKIIAAVAAVSLAFPGAAFASHVTDEDGPAVSSVNGICHSKPGKDWRASQYAAALVYYNAYLATGYTPYIELAKEHLVYVAWFDGVCK